jgi:hypothetical protein
MRGFLMKFVCFALIQAAFFSILLLRYDPTRQSAAFSPGVEKHRRLETAPPPRLVLIGGSNLPFGIESDTLERELHRSVVNMGWLAGLGVEFMLSEVEPELRRGDAVVLSLEYDHFARGLDDRLGAFDPSALQQALIARPAGVLRLKPLHIRKILLDRGLVLFGEIARRSLGIAPAQTLEEQRAARAAFNQWGDLISHRAEPSRYRPEELAWQPLVGLRPGFPSRVLLKRIANFCQRCDARGVRVYFTFTPKPIGTIKRDGDLANQLASELRKIPNLTVLDSPADHAYPPEQFYDTANHLTGPGARLRTAKLAAELRPFLTPTNPP